ncbi:hypothetical protein MMC30_007001 [Trapelia coarctata]|nr:hypothetical protein [Trapelia coarctata]
MAQDPTTYLAATVLNDGSIVTYRSLSRQLKVNINVAKRILYDFHQKQTSKKAGSVHATYLVSGMQAVNPASNGVHETDEDTPMQSSPFMSSSMPHQDVDEHVAVMRVMTLAREEHLEGKEAAAKAKYETISSIHIYSLEPSTIQDLNVLSEVRRDITEKYAKEDPLLVAQQYGTISNPRVKRRTGPRPAIAPSSTTPVTQTKPASSVPASKVLPKASTPSIFPSTLSQPLSKMEVKQEQPKATSTSKKATTKTPAMKREMSDIFKSFSKPKPKLTKEETGSSHGGTPAPETPQSETASNPIDAPMKDASEDEQEEDVVALTKDSSSSTQRKLRLERKEALRKMMDDEDEEMSDAPPVPPAAGSQDEVLPAEAPASQEEGPSEPLVIVSGGRRRGKRQVMKKKTLKDDEGYLVTKEEAAWESFSEDEPAPATASTKPRSSLPASSAAAKEKKKGAAKTGQGSITSFFGKK